MGNATERKREIINVAKSLFLTQGYERTTIEAIINTMGVSKGMFYHHYKSKDEVLNDVLDSVADTITRDTVSILTNKDLNAKEKIEELFKYKRKMIYQTDNGKEIKNKIFWTQFYGIISKKCLKIINPYFTNLIYEGIEEGCFKIKNAKYTALVFTSLFVYAGSMQKEIIDLFDDVEESLAASKELCGRMLGCEFDE